MTPNEARALKVGDRVLWNDESTGTTEPGTVVKTGRNYLEILWGYVGAKPDAIHPNDCDRVSREVAK